MERRNELDRERIPGASTLCRGPTVVCLLLVGALLGLMGCDSLPFIGGPPDPELEYSVRFTGHPQGNAWAEATAGEGEIRIEGQIWTLGGIDVTAELEARRSRLTLNIVPCLEPGSYIIPLTFSYDFHASISRLRSRTYEVIVQRGGNCGEGDPVAILLEEHVTVR